MVINKNENIVPVDVDKTLILPDYWNYPQLPVIEYNYYGIKKKAAVHTAHVELVRSYKKRGFFIRVWSNNGWKHCKEIIDQLDLVDFVDEIEAKSHRFVDDLEANEVLGSRVYINPADVYEPKNK